MEWLQFRFNWMNSTENTTRIIKFELIPSITYFEHTILKLKTSNISFSWLFFEIKIRIKYY